MKKFIPIISLFFLAVLAGSFNSCEKLSPAEQEKGSLEIAIDLSEGILKSAISDSVVSTEPDTLDPSPARQLQIMVSILNKEGVPVMEDELIPLFNFGSGFISKKIELETGEYTLVKFMVINAAGEVLFAAPVEGSPKSYLVLKPLPVGFNISTQGVTRIVPEVLAVLNESPQEFGYAAFGFQVVKPLPFYVMAVIGDSVMDTTGIRPPTIPTEALLTVFTPNGWSHRFKLKPEVNRIEVRGGAEYYMLVCEKEGYPPVKLRFTPRELLSSTPENPLIIRLSLQEIHVLTIKPGPREGKDAMISNLDPDKNFGDHKYFEASFLSEPILTVMRSNRSLIWFDINALPKSARIKRVVLTLFYEMPVIYENAGYDKPVSDDNVRYGAVLQQIVEPWEEYKVSWNNQPKTTEVNQVFVSPLARNTNMINIDVTSLYVPVKEINLRNYGMLFKLYPDEKYPGSLRFASSDYPEKRMHPELKIFYSLP